MEFMIQSQNDIIQSQMDRLQSINRLEVKVSHLVKTINDRNEETLPNTFSTTPDSPSHIDEKSWYLGDFNQDSISSHNFELDQYQPIDKLASFHFNEIELEEECDTDYQCCDSVQLFDFILTSVSLPDLDLISMPTLISIPIELEHESLILDSHILLLENKCELEFYDLNQTHGPTLTLESKLDLSFIPESVSVPIHFIIEPKSFP